MSCCCDTYESGLYGLNGLSGLMGQLLAEGSQVRVGFAYNFESTSAGVNADRQGPGWLRSAIVTQLQYLDIFSSINVDVKPPAYQNFQDGYITIQVTLKDAQGSPSHIGDTAQYAIQAYAPGIFITRRDDVVIDYAAPGSVAQRTPQQQQLPSPPGQASQCRWETMSFGDYVACQLGISSPIGGIGIGAMGALVGVGVITLLAVVLLKR